MSRQNKKESVAALHRENILSAAEKLFIEKGIAGTTIDDIAKLSEYSRRTIYVYYESKDDILYHIILKDLTSLKENVTESLEGQKDFIGQYYEICAAMEKYHTNNPHSADSVNQLKRSVTDFNTIPQIVMQIFELCQELNKMLAAYIEGGKQQGVVRADVDSMKTVYVMWAGLSALLSLVQSKSVFIEKEFSDSREGFLEYGYKQLINAILEDRI